MKTFGDYIGKGEFEVYIINKTSLKIGKRKIEINKDRALIDNKRLQFIYLTGFMEDVLKLNKAFGYFLEEKDAKEELLEYAKLEKKSLEKRLEKVNRALKELE
jgi:hypothetical protein